MGMIVETLDRPIIRNIGKKKRERNIKHDKEVTAMFEARGWTVLRIWECELQKKNLDGTVEKIKQILSVERYPGR